MKLIYLLVAFTLGGIFTWAIGEMIAHPNRNSPPFAAGPALGYFIVLCIRVCCKKKEATTSPAGEKEEK